MGLERFIQHKTIALENDVKGISESLITASVSFGTGFPSGYVGHGKLCLGPL
jgi:hypothetical protein